MRNQPLLLRFLQKVSIGDGCWNWCGWTDGKDGYGKIALHHNYQVRAHRVSYELFVGQIPKGMSVCHKCDNPACVRPDHLFLGTALDNKRDEIRKGRQAIGEKSGNSPLTEGDVRMIHVLSRFRGMSSPEIASMFHVDQAAIYRIVRGITWKHLHYPPNPRPAWDC